MKNTILHILSYITIFIGLALFIPAGVSYFYHEPYISLFIILGVACISLGIVLRILFTRAETINFKSIILSVVFTWIVTAVIGALPYFFSGAISSFVDCFFESMSGFTTTGATILEDIEVLPKSILFWRSFTHWLGGMGVVLLIIAILPSFGVKGMQLFQAEVSGGSINQKRRTGTADMPMWATMAGIGTLLVSLPLTLRTGIINGGTLAIVVVITIFSGLWLFLDRNRNEI